MGATKRMSAEEKRQAILGIYHNSTEVYIEKEIIALATKAGVNAGTIADINNALVDDGLVDKEKIGGSNYFWSFPTKKERKMQLQHEETLKHIEELKVKNTDSESKLADAKRGREENDDGERAKKLARLGDLSKERTDNETELETLKENDPQALVDLDKELKLVVGSANRWTDNLFTCKAYLTKKRGMDPKEASRILGITATFDYPEDKIPK